MTGLTSEDIKKGAGWMCTLVLTGILIWARAIDDKVGDQESHIRATTATLNGLISDVATIEANNTELLKDVAGLQASLDGMKDMQGRIYQRLDGVR